MFNVDLAHDKINDGYRLIVNAGNFHYSAFSVDKEQLENVYKILNSVKEGAEFGYSEAFMKNQDKMLELGQLKKLLNIRK